MNSPRDKNLTLSMCVLGGALAGLGFGYLLINRSKENKRSISLSAGEGISLAFMIVGFIRQISQFGDDHQSS